MANGKTHLLVGASVGATVAMLDNKKHPISHNLISASTLRAVMGKLPDLIEPASNPNHRQFFHSITTFTLLSTALIKTYKWSPETPLETLIRGAILISGTAYLSHLVFDAITPKGLPFIGNF